MRRICVSSWYLLASGMRAWSRSGNCYVGFTFLGGMKERNIGTCKRGFGSGRLASSEELSGECQDFTRT